MKTRMKTRMKTQCDVCGERAIWWDNTFGAVAYCVTCCPISKNGNGAVAKKPAPASKPKSKNLSDKLCMNCGEMPQAHIGLCSACYTYQLRHDGNPRPPADRLGQGSDYCIICGRDTRHVGRRKRCSACAQYKHRYGEERPRQMWSQQRSFEECRNCGISLIGREQAKGRCTNCYAYYRRTGRERPEHLLAYRSQQKSCVMCGQAVFHPRRGMCPKCYWRKRHWSEEA